MLPRLERQVNGQLGLPGPRDVDENAETAELVGQLVHDETGICRGGIKGDRDAPLTAPLDLPGGLGGPFGVVVHGQPDVEALGGKEQRRGPADAGVGAGHDGKPREGAARVGLVVGAHGPHVPGRPRPPARSLYRSS